MKKWVFDIDMPIFRQISDRLRDEIAAGTLLQMPVRLPDFAFDIHFNPLPEFAGKTVCQLLQQTLQENLK